jgi:hypothetical protein
MLGLVITVTAATCKLKRQFIQPAFMVLLSIVVAANVSLNIQYGRLSRSYGYPYTISWDHPAGWKDYEEVFQWLQINTKPDDIIASGLDTMIYLYTGRQAFRPFAHRPESLFYGASPAATGTVIEFFSLLDSVGANYLVMFPMLDFSEKEPFEKLVVEAQKEHPDRLTPLYQLKDKRFIIFKVTGTKKVNISKSTSSDYATNMKILKSQSVVNGLTCEFSVK